LAVPGPKLIHLELTDQERLALGAWARRHTTTLRSRIVLRCASSQGPTLAEAAEPPPGPEWAQRLPSAARAPRAMPASITVLPRPAVRTR